MANEKRLIDANRALEIVRDQGIAHPNAYHLTNYATLILREAPTVQAVEVVRCKDCAFWTYEGVGSSSLKRFGRCAKWYPFGNEQHSCHDDDFCSYGERREGE